MKILVVSLLRIGDLFMQKPLLEGLREKYPDAQIDIVVNSVAVSAAALLKDTISNVYVFSRDEYQRSAGEAHFNIFWGVDQIDKLIDQLSEQSYDVVYNFTHNKLSAYLIGAIQSWRYEGLRYKNGQFAGIDNSWLEYFNDNFAREKKSVFHYTDLLAKSFGIEAHRTTVRKNIQKSGLILMQCFTSEARKNWPVSSFFELKNKIETEYPFHIVRVLATEKEKQDLLHFFADEEIWVVDFEMAETLLKEARLFIGVDTSVKHLAAICGTPVIEIALGGSDPIKTGPYIAEAISLKDDSNINVEDVFAEVQCFMSLNRKVRDSEQNLQCDQWVWSAYLDGHESGHESGHDSVQWQNMPETNAGYVARSFKLLEWQLRLEKTLTESSDLYLKQNLQTLDLEKFILIAQEILKSNLDTGAYFQKFIEVLTEASNRGDVFYTRVSEAIGLSRSLLKLRSELAIGARNVSESREASSTGV